MAKKGKYVYEWPRPMVTVDAVVFGFKDKRPKVLLINRRKEPFKGIWALPGGFIELDEELEDSAARELAEETKLINVRLKQLRAFGKIGRDPRGRQISIAFMGIVEKPDDNVKGGDDAQEARWFDIDKLPEELAFDHDEIINCAIEELKIKQYID